MKRILCVLSVFLFCVCMIVPANVYAYDLPNGLDTDDEVTFGIYDHESNALIQSDPVEFGNHFLDGLAQCLYEDNYALCIQYNIALSDIKTFLLSNVPSGILNASLNGWLINVVRVNDSYSNLSHSGKYSFVGIRIPSTNGHPSLDFSNGSSDDTYTWTFLPSGSSFILTQNIPNFGDTFVGAVGGFSPQSNYTSNVYTYDILRSYYTYDYTFLADPSFSIFYQHFNFTVSSEGCSFSSYDESSYPANSSMFCYAASQRTLFFDRVLLSVFPFFSTAYIHAGEYANFSYDCPPVSSFYSTSSLTNIYLSTYTSVTPDPTLAPGVSPTPPVWITPTPYPGFVPPTPSPGAPVENYYESIGDLMTLLTRHYDLVISGYTIAFSPFNVFLACVIIGLIVRIFFGGNHE